MFRKQGMGNYRDLLMTIAKNPTMIFWLDNNQNHGTAVNENWGRELLELFSLGAGNYTEVDVREASRAFTGWTFETKLPRLPYGRFPWKFEYRPEDHDDGDKTFLGHKGNFNGEDIIDIIVQQPACAKFICRHLYNFFVADEPQVPAWNLEDRAIRQAIDAWRIRSGQSKCEIKPVLRALFNSDFFKNARFTHLKSPAEVVVGTLRVMGGFEVPRPGCGELSMQPSYMGQDLLNPPSVEGWHTGSEWINSGSLMARINFVAEQVGNTQLPGVQGIVNRLQKWACWSRSSWSTAASTCWVRSRWGTTREKVLTEQARQWGQIRWDTTAHKEAAAKHTGELLQLIVATREYQFA